MEHEGLELVRLAGAEIDDQAIAEISGLLGPSLDAMSPAALIRLAASGPLIVARRPCGAWPEIVGVAGLARPHPEAAAEEIVAVDATLADRDLAPALLAFLRSQSQRLSLFRNRDRAPLGLACGQGAGR